MLLNMMMEVEDEWLALNKEQFLQEVREEAEGQIDEYFAGNLANDSMKNQMHGY